LWQEHWFGSLDTIQLCAPFLPIKMDTWQVHAFYGKYKNVILAFGRQSGAGTGCRD
jgi:hypothetical protein